jgi:hypothetical protein
MARRGLVPLLIMAVMLPTAGCGSGETSDQAPPPSTSASSSQELIDLRDIAQLRSLFNSRLGEPRLVLLVSPT